MIDHTFSASPDPDAVRLLIADDHAMVRASFCRLLQGEPGFVVVATSSDGPSTLAAVDAHDLDVVLLDLSMPATQGTDLISGIRGLNPALGVLVVSMFDNPHLVSAAIKAGANGYITKDSDPDTLVAAIRQVAGGGAWLGQNGGAEPGGDPGPVLSSRETEVLCLLAAGHTNSEIASVLGISEKTVSTHKVNLMTKLDLHNTADLVRYANQNLLIKP